MIAVGENAVAYVYMQAPIVIVLEGYRSALPHALDAVIIGVADVDAANLSATPQALRAAFGSRALAGDLKPAGFSVQDLWFDTL